MVYYPKHGLSDNGVAYSVAHLLLIDARVNNLTLPGFPSISAKLVGDIFEIIFEKNGQTSQSLALTLKEAKRLYKGFQSQKLTSDNEREIFDKIQNIAANFEGFRKF